MRTPICSDNWMSVHGLALRLFLLHYVFFLFVCFKNDLSRVYFPASTAIIQTIHKPHRHRFMNPKHRLPLFLITGSRLFRQLTLPHICMTEVAKKVPRLNHPHLAALFALVPSISCYCWQLSRSPSIDPSPGEKIRWRIEMDSISII